MRALRVVGITEDGGEPSVVLEDPARQERFTVPADEQLRAAARGDLTRLGQIAIELESQLRPREIQARIRAGASVDQVAAAAGVPAQKIERFAYPVLLERSRTAEVAQRAHPMRADGPDNRMLADVVAHTFSLRGQEYGSAEWDSWKGDDGRWVVALSWRAGRSDNRALWTFQPGAHGGTVTAIDEYAHDLIEGLPARPLRTVGPVIEMARPDEQPPSAPEEGHELRAAASDIAARRDVSDWSRVAPEPRRPEPRRSAPRPEPAEVAHPYVRPGRLDEPATEWPTPQGSASAAIDRPGHRDDGSGSALSAPLAADHGVPAAGDAASAEHHADSAGRAAPGDVTAAPWARTGAAPAADLPADVGDADAIRPTGPAAAAPTAAAPTAAAPTAAAPTAAAPTAAAPTAAAPTAAAAPAPTDSPGAATVPSARSPKADCAPADPVAATAPAGGSTEEPPTPDHPSTEPPAPRPAEPAPQAPKRGRKGKPVMPSWDEVLLGVRSQR